jgi:hypothetical protein
MIRPGSNRATNNDDRFFEYKVKIREQALSFTKNNYILQTHAGAGDLWKKVKSDCVHFKIDADNRFDVDYVGDSLAFLKNNDITKYGLIDIDSWGSPAKYLEIIFQKKYTGIIVCTFCTPVLLNPDKILALSYFGLAYTKSKRKAKLNIGANKLILNYLNKKGIKTINGYLSPKKCYFWFKINSHEH